MSWVVFAVKVSIGPLIQMKKSSNIFHSDMSSTSCMFQSIDGDVQKSAANPLPIDGHVQKGTEIAYQQVHCTCSWPDS